MTPRRVALHRVGEFTGDIDILTRRAPVVSAFARGETELLRVSSPDVRQIISARPGIGDTLLRAFIARREQLQPRVLARDGADSFSFVTAQLLCKPLTTALNGTPARGE